MRRGNRQTTVASLLVAVVSVSAWPGLWGATGPVQNQGRLLTAEEGRRLVEAARSRRHRIQGTLDCSHLVNAVYQQAGFPYPYSPSDTLFRGIRGFVRVKNPQPGDLVVWRGHVGIVTDPAESTFYSWLSSGPGLARYDAGYWRRRRPMRFYRYVLSERQAAMVTVAASVPNDTSTGNATLASVVVAANRSKPSRESVGDAVARLSGSAGEVLRTDNLAELPTPVVFYDGLRVKKVKVKKDHGWAEVEVTYRVALDRGRFQIKKRRQKVRCELRQDGSGWHLFPPNDRVLVPQHAAVRELAENLARSARKLDPSGEDHRRQAELAMALNALLSEED